MNFSYQSEMKFSYQSKLSTILMTSQSEHMSVAQPEAPVKLDQAAATLDDEPVLEEGGVKFAPHFPEPCFTPCVPKLVTTMILQMLMCRSL